MGKLHEAEMRTMQGARLAISLLLLAAILLSSVACKKEVKPFIPYLGIELGAQDIPTSGYKGFSSSECINVEFQYPETYGAMLVIPGCFSTQGFNYRGDQSEKFYLRLDARVNFEALSYPEINPATNSVVRCDEYSWQLPKDNLSGIPIGEFSCDTNTNAEGWLFVLINAINDEMILTIQAGIDLNTANIEDFKNVVNEFVNSLYIDFDQWKAINEGRN
jgi:hypothetical protein